MITLYAAGAAGERTELQGRFSGVGDLDELYARHAQRFPQVRNLTGAVGQGGGPAALVEVVGQTYMAADPLLAVVPPLTDIGFDSWCPRDGGGGSKYWDRVPLSAMTRTGYFNCLSGTALAGRALSEAGHPFALLVCPAVPTHPYLQLTGRPDVLFSFHHDGLRRLEGHAEVRGRRWAPEELAPVSDYGPQDGIYGLSIPEHFLVLTRLVPTPGNAERAAGAFEDLAAGLDGCPRLAPIAELVRGSVLPRLRRGPLPFTRTVELAAAPAAS